MRKLTLVIAFMLSITALEAQDARLRADMKGYLDAVVAKNQTAKDDATLELHKETVRRELARIAQSAQAIAEARAFRRTQFTAESRRLDRQTAGDAGNGGTTAITALLSSQS